MKPGDIKMPGQLKLAIATYWISFVAGLVVSFCAFEPDEPSADLTALETALGCVVGALALFAVPTMVVRLMRGRSGARAILGWLLIALLPFNVVNIGEEELISSSMIDWVSMVVDVVIIALVFSPAARDWSVRKRAQEEGKPRRRSWGLMLWFNVGMFVLIFGCVGVASGVAKDVFYLLANAIRTEVPLPEVIVLEEPEEEKPSAAETNATEDDTDLDKLEDLMNRIIAPDEESIEELGFKGRVDLRSVVIPASVTQVVASAFSGCVNLTNIVVAAGNQHFCSMDGALYTKDGHELVVWPYGRKEVRIPEGVTAIRCDAVDDGVGMRSMALPSTLTNLCANCLLASTGTVSVTIADANRCFFVNDGFIFSKDGKKLVACLSAESEVRIPDGIEEIGLSAFKNRVNLRQVEMPESLMTIGRNAFLDCHELSFMKIPASVTNIDCMSVPESVEVVVFMGDKPIVHEDAKTLELVRIIKKAKLALGMLLENFDWTKEVATNRYVYAACDRKGWRSGESFCGRSVVVLPESERDIDAFLEKARRSLALPMGATRWRAEQGDAASQFVFGLGYDDGTAGRESACEAAWWFRKSAEQGYAPAQFILGVCYQVGDGVLQDGREALEWYKKSLPRLVQLAKEEDRMACALLSTAYENGYGVEKNPRLKRLWEAH